MLIIVALKINFEYFGISFRTFVFRVPCPMRKTELYYGGFDVSPMVGPRLSLGCLSKTGFPDEIISKSKIRSFC